MNTLRSSPIPAADNEQEQLQMLRALSEEPGASQRQLASTLGMSLGKANYLLRALIEKGFLKAENYKNSKNKLSYLYILTPSGIAEKAALTREFLTRKEREYERLRLEIERLRLDTDGTPRGR